MRENKEGKAVDDICESQRIMRQSQLKIENVNIIRSNHTSAKTLLATKGAIGCTTAGGASPLPKPNLKTSAVPFSYSIALLEFSIFE